MRAHFYRLFPTSDAAVRKNLDAEPTGDHGQKTRKPSPVTNSKREEKQSKTHKVEADQQRRNTLNHRRIRRTLDKKRVDLENILCHLRPDSIALRVFDRCGEVVRI